MGEPAVEWAREGGWWGGRKAAGENHYSRDFPNTGVDAQEAAMEQRLSRRPPAQTCASARLAPPHEPRLFLASRCCGWSSGCATGRL